MARTKETVSDTGDSARPRRSLLVGAGIPAALVLTALVLCVSYVGRPAFVFDETYYFEFATGVRNWLANPAFDDNTLGKVFYEGNYHPPLPLYLMALTNKVFCADIQDFLISTRMASAGAFAGLVLITYLFISSEAGIAAGLFAALLTLFSPRLFAHSLMATYDMPMALAWAATTAAFWKGMESRRWAVAAGVISGLALLTKENALFLPAALWIWGAVVYRKKSAWAIASMAVLGAVVFYAGWPWLWRHPLANTARYVMDKIPQGSMLDFLRPAGAAAAAWRQAIPTLYFGEANPSGPPWHYPFVTALIATPVATLAGIVSAAFARRTGRLAAFIAWSACAQLLVFATIAKPYDGERLFLGALPLVSMLGGLGLAALLVRGKAVALAAIILVALSPVAEFFVYEPYGMSYFTGAVGGLPGAAWMGMEVTYYGEAVTPEEFRAVNESSKEGDSVAYGPMFKKMPYRMPDEYIRYGYLRLGLKPEKVTGDWDYLIFINRGGSVEESDRAALERGRVIGENRLLGVTLSQVLERRQAVTETVDASR